MSIFGFLRRVQEDYVPLDEQIEAAERLLDTGTATPGGGGNWVPMIVIGVAILIVVAMLLSLIGRKKRVVEDSDDQTDPLFDEALPSFGDDTGDAGFGEIVIEDNFDAIAEDRPAGGVSPYRSAFGSAFRSSDDAEDAPRDVKIEEVSAEESEEDVSREEVEDASGDETLQGADIVQLRSEEDLDKDEVVTTAAALDAIEDDEPVAEDEEEEVVADEPQPAVSMMHRAAPAEPQEEPVRDTAPAAAEADTDRAEPRYAFGAHPTAPAHEAPINRPAYRDEDTYSARDDGGRPYIAPFIREDIERAERRQTERIDRLRQDLSQSVETWKLEQNSRLDLLVASIDRKLERLERVATRPAAATETPATTPSRDALAGQVDRITDLLNGQGQKLRSLTQFFEAKMPEFSRIYDEIKGVHEEVKSTRTDLGGTNKAFAELRTDFEGMREHVGRLERAILDRAAQDSATQVRLSDVIRGTLPQGTYEFGAVLNNGEKADCVVGFEGLPEKVAIDAGFPMEAFHELPSRDAVRRNLPQAKSAEDGFRRAILRAILEAADRCIAPGETADSCILFLPSEAAYTILHDRFPDLVRDSQRARVWLVSPSTLMGTLQLMLNMMPDADTMARRNEASAEAQAKRAEDQRLRDEVDSLRKRARDLSEELNRTRGTLSELISSTEKLTVPEVVRDRDDVMVEIVPEKDNDGIIESLKFDGTPDWSSPLEREPSYASDASDKLFDDESDYRKR